MPRVVEAAIQTEIANMITSGIGQRDIERQTGVSRQFIRKIARSIGHQFPRNGIENAGSTCMCCNCGGFFRKPPSKIVRARNQFCTISCKNDYYKGVNHTNWKGGEYSDSFSKWAKNQNAYQAWREAVLEKDGNKCVISGKTENLDCHHIEMKSENPERAFDVSNGMTLNKQVHVELHKLTKQDLTFDEAVEELKKKYANEQTMVDQEKVG